MMSRKSEPARQPRTGSASSPAASASSKVAARPGLVALIGCSLLLIAFAVLAHLAVSSKSPTYDEPLHAVSAWLQLRFGDFRIDPEDPTLWKYWAALPNSRDALNTNGMQDAVRESSRDGAMEWPFVHSLLYRATGNMERSDDFIQRSRNMMLILGLGLGALIGWWSWRLALNFERADRFIAVVAAIVATGFYSLDPNFLGHASLVKNDVPLSLVMLALIISVWRMGQRVTVWNLLAVALLCAAAVNTKFSALLLGPIVAVLLVVRAIVPMPWNVFGRALQTIPKKLAVSIAACLFAAIISYAGTWAVYHFRFRPAPAPDSRMAMARMVEYTKLNELRASGNRQPTTQQIRAHPHSRVVKTVLFLDKHRILPQAFLNGFLYTYQSALVRGTYLVGEYSMTGWWYYFPLAMLLKSPLALIVAAISALGVYIAALRQRSANETSDNDRNLARWTAACLAIPPVIYMIAAMRSNLNLGLRHVLPVYPFIFIGIGLAAGCLWQRRPKPAAIATALLGLALFLEGTVFTFPDYIAFFNAPAKPSRINLLGDSNLDWGQDLKLLARWQQQNPDIPLYLVYFGVADPWAYGINYVNFPGGYPFGPEYQVKLDPGVVAISATHLQGIYYDSDLQRAYGTLRKKEPVAVLGGTIYLYPWPPQLQRDDAP